MSKIVRYFKSQRNLTAERPVALEADVLARYYFAKKYCKRKNVLDIGTGFGMGANFVANNGAKEVLGIDYNKEVIKEALRSRVKKTNFRFLDAMDLNKLTGKFGVILAFEIIEHLPLERVGEFVSKIYDSLAPGGILLLTTPNKFTSATFLGGSYNPYHVKEYTSEELKNIFQKYFSSVKILGMRCTSDKYKNKQSALESTLIHKISFVLGHFKIVREFLALIPRDMKRSVTGEENLPNLTEKDYELSESHKNATGLFVIASKSAVSNKLPSASVIIANYNGESFLSKCLKSVLATNYTNFEVIVCDDGSSDRSIEIVKEFGKTDKRLKLLRNKKNLGAAGTRNKAYAIAKNDIIVFLDNDTVVTRNWLRELVAPFSEDATVGGVQALLLDMKDKSLVQQAGAILMRQTGWSVPLHQWETYSKVKKKIKTRPIVGVSGALAVRRDVFVENLGFDEKEAVYTEDIDFSWRLWILGYKVLLSPTSHVYHFAKKVDERKRMNVNYYKIYFHLAKNSFRSILKNYETGNAIKYLAISVTVNIVRAVMVAIRRGDLSALMATFGALGWSVANLEDILKKRKYIQKTRVFSDKHIMDTVFENVFQIGYAPSKS